MKKMIIGSVLVLLANLWTSGAPLDTAQLKPKAVYGKEAKVIAYILDNNHYRKIAFNDSLSSVILDEYVKNLDNNKTYFTASDLASFEKYRTKLDDMTKAGECRCSLRDLRRVPQTLRGTDGLRNQYTG